ncbi:MULTISPECIES: serine/threonine-protein kinase [Myxococcaceae]|uniref:serine/threonine-protein kinase n=1 Tax=Myxococcaceae TaxID=31 RepID=UPI00188ECD1E|nr:MULTISPECIES: serine/threonine-protein kinase [Myxococcaceae]MBF5044619.1 serine/threonine protein kinase [Simulacricoccus sp. 17bor-14]
MSPQPSPCLDENTLAALGTERLPAAERERAAAHLDGCAACRELLAALGHLDSALPASAAAAPLAAPAPEALAPGAAVGRFIVLHPVGQGGMGRVYAAYDPQLDRRVALKLLHPEAWGAEATHEGRARLLREAQAMARLSHPHVVTVYEVGLWGEQLFLAMEYVEGQTLRAWLRERPRAWREVLRVFVDAGRGLAAAHHKGLVHRDFKPENVLVGADGRVRVTDFGLVQPTGSLAQPLPPGARSAADASTGPLHTGRGRVLGTPGYIAPEHYRGLDLDARADQFAFCAALYEGLYAQRPFAPREPEALRDAVLSGRVEPVPASSRVPGAVRALVQTGLAVEPSARHASLDLLLGRLERALTGRRTRSGLLAAALLALLLVGLGVQSARKSAQVCSGGPAKLAGVWDGGVRAAVERTLRETGKSYAPETARHVAQLLDGYAGAWTGMYAEACEATAVRKEQSAELLDLRMQCLERRREDLRALTGLLQHADAAMLDKAPQAASGLPAVAVCADAEALRSALPPPPGDAARARLDALRRELSAASSLAALGRLSEGYARAEAAAKEAQALGYVPAVAEALLARGQLGADLRPPEEVEATLREAALAAGRARDDRLLVSAWGRLVQLMAQKEERREATDELVHALTVTTARVGRDPGLHAGVERALAMLAARRGEFARAKPLFEEALGHYEEAGDERMTAITLGNLGHVQRELGQLDEASARVKRGIGILERLLGPAHPDNTQLLNVLGAIHWKKRELESARAVFERVLRVREEAFGPQSAPVGLVELNMGAILIELWRLDEAQVHLERAAALLEKTRGAKSQDLAATLDNLGIVLRRKGEPQRALALHRRAADIYRGYFGADHPMLASLTLNAALALSDAGAHAEAQREMQRAVALYEKRFGAGTPDTAEAYSCLGEVLHAAGREREALAAYGRAQALLEKAGGDALASLFAVHDGVAPVLLALGRAPEALAHLRSAEAGRGQQQWGTVERALHQLSLGQALWATGEDRARGRELLLQAREALRALHHPVAARQLVASERWMAQQRAL